MITVENCLEKCSQKQISDTGDIASKSASWSVIYDLCIQQGMNIHDDTSISGLQKVVEFILEQKKIDELKVLRELREYAFAEFGESISDYIIRDFIKKR